MTNMSGATLAPYVACRRAGTPVVNMLHDLWLLCPNNMLYRADGSLCNPAEGHGRCRQCFRRYDFWGDIPYRRSVFAALTSNVRLFIAPSQALIDRHMAAGYEPDRFRLVRHGMHSEFAPSIVQPDVRRIVATQPAYQTLLFAGGGIEIKGAGVVLRAVPDLLARWPQLRLVVAGGGEAHYLKQFNQYAPRVQMLGPVLFQDMKYLMASADLMLVPSTCHENSPMTILESLQVGTPSVGSDFGGIPELIRHDETGYLFPVNDAAALAAMIDQHFMRRPEQRRRMRQACVRIAQTQFTLDNHIDGILNVYCEALN
jgi:glycosyltransferase involved in cell wall biosynthesis